jgi:Dullard-like phosphatase family protein
MDSQKNNDILYKLPNQENKTNNNKSCHKNCKKEDLISNFEKIDIENTNTNENGNDNYFKNSEEIDNKNDLEIKIKDKRRVIKTNSLIIGGKIKGLTLDNEIKEEDRFISTHLPTLNKNTLLNENYKKSDINMPKNIKDDNNRSFKRHSTFACNFSKKLNLFDFTENFKYGKNKEEEKKKLTKFDNNNNYKLTIAKTKKSDEEIREEIKEKLSKDNEEDNNIEEEEVILANRKVTISKNVIRKMTVLKSITNAIMESKYGKKPRTSNRFSIGILENKFDIINDETIRSNVSDDLVTILEKKNTDSPDVETRQNKTNSLYNKKMNPIMEIDTIIEDPINERNNTALNYCANIKKENKSIALLILDKIDDELIDSAIKHIGILNSEKKKNFDKKNVRFSQKVILDDEDDDEDDDDYDDESSVSVRKVNKNKSSNSILKTNSNEDIDHENRKNSSFDDEDDNEEYKRIRQQYQNSLNSSPNKSVRTEEDKNIQDDDNEINNNLSSNLNLLKKEDNLGKKLIDEIEEEKIKLNIENLIDLYYLDINENFQGNYEEYVVNNMTIISYLTKVIQEKFNLKVPELNKENKEKVKNFDKDKKVLFLDLDETLIHSDLNGEYEDCDACIKMKLPDRSVTRFNILIRPYTNEFLQYASEHFNLVLFTAGLKDYADAIIDHIDPEDKFFKLRLYRDSCTYWDNFYLKDLGILPNFDINKSILIDNCMFSFVLNLGNGILIPSYYNDSEDKELINITDYLDDKIKDAENVMEINEGFFGFISIKEHLYERLIEENIIQE